MENKVLAFIEKKHPTYQLIIDTFFDEDENALKSTLLKL